MSQNIAFLDFLCSEVIRPVSWAFPILAIELPGIMQIQETVEFNNIAGWITAGATLTMALFLLPQFYDSLKRSILGFWISSLFSDRWRIRWYSYHPDRYKITPFMGGGCSVVDYMKGEEVFKSEDGISFGGENSEVLRLAKQKEDREKQQELRMKESMSKRSFILEDNTYLSVEKGHIQAVRERESGSSILVGGVWLETKYSFKDCMDYVEQFNDPSVLDELFPDEKNPVGRYTKTKAAIKNE